MKSTPSENRNATIAAAVTPTEKRRAELVATIRGRTLSELLRDHSINDLVAEGERIAQRVRDFDSAA